MQRHTIANILQKNEDGNPVVVCGWIKTKRDSKAFSFVVLNDGSSQRDLQIVVDLQTPGYQELSGCGTGSAIMVEGRIKQSQGGAQTVEVHADRVKVFGSADASYPLQKKGHTLEFLREIAHLRPRTNTFGAVFRVRNAIAFSIHQFFQERGFLWVHTPIITANDCEGAGELFQVTTMDLNQLPKGTDGKVDFSKDFFGEATHLTVSGQLEGEFLALSLGSIYTFGPTFRAENSNTSRHLAEFWMIEPEVAFAELKDMMNLAEDFFKQVCRDVLLRCPDELDFLAKMYKGTSLESIERLAQGAFGKISYTQAIEELSRAKQEFSYPVAWGQDLQSEHERYLSEQVFKTPVIVTDYPKDIKAFYMKLNSDNKTVAAMDVLVPGIGELIGGSQREDDEDRLKMRMKEMNIPHEKLDWYLQLRRFGSCPHAGFGLGFERLVQYITGMGNIRDTIPCPRVPGYARF